MKTLISSFSIFFCVNHLWKRGKADFKDHKREVNVFISFKSIQKAMQVIEEFQWQICQK